MSVLKKLFFAFVPLLAILVIVEVAFRLRPHKDRGDTVGGLTEPDPHLLWRLKPASEGAYITNELGLRDGPHNPDADVKILLLGDSVSWGDGVPDLELCYPFMLETALNRIDSTRTYEIVNAGVPGYSTFQEAEYLKRHGLVLEPDLIVLQFCLNDVTARYHDLASYGGDNVFLGIDTRTGISGVRGFLIRHSRAAESFARYLQRRSRDREEYEVEKLARDELSPQLRDAWDLALSEIDEIRRVAREHEIPLVLLIAPYRFQLEDPEGTRQPQDVLIAYSREHGIPALDLLPGLAQGPREYPLFFDPSHFSVYGHYQTARILLPSTLASLGLR